MLLKIRLWTLILFLTFCERGGIWAATWQRDPVLSQFLVKQMVTDATGYRWVATSEGVYRYDGYDLVPLSQLVQAGSAAPPTVTVLTLAFDPAGCLWIGGEEGLFYFSLASRRLQQVALPQVPSINRPGVAALFIHPRSGHLWVGYEASVVVFDPHHPTQPISPPRQVGGSPHFFQADGSATGVWLSFRQPNWPVRRVYTDDLAPGAVQLPLKGTPLRRLASASFVVPVVGTEPLQVLSASARFELLPSGQLRELQRWLPKGNEDNFMLRNATGDSVCEWASQGFRMRLTVRGRRAGHLSLDTLRLGSGPADHRHSYVLDQDPLGIEWCYSQFWRGCYKRRPIRPRVVQPLRLANGRPTPSTRAITRLPDGRLLLGAYGGPLVQAADSPDAPLRPLPIMQNGVSRLPMGYDLLVIPTGEVIFCEDARGFSILNPKTNELEGLYFSATERHLPVHNSAMLADRAGRIWAGTSSGLFRLYPAQRRVVRYTIGAAGRWLPQLEIVGMAEDPGSGDLWLATNKGLYLLTPDTGKLRRIGARDQAAQSRPLPTDALLCVRSAGPGRVWVGTNTAGLLLVDARNGLVRQLDLIDGLPSHTVATVLRQPDGTIWAGTFAGIVRYEPAAQRLAVLTEDDGLTDAEMNRNSAFADPLTGALFMGGVGGLHRIWPGKPVAMAHYTPARLLVTAIAEPAGSGEGDSSSVTRVVTTSILPHLSLRAGADAFVEVRLALTDYFTPDLTHYAYRLRRLHGAPISPWLPTTRRLMLRGLSPGEYEVEARAETAIGQQAANTVRLPLTVAQVWWLHPLALIGAALLLVLLGYGVFWLRLLRMRREARLREHLAANLHDEMGALLTRINLQAQVLRERYRQPQLTNSAEVAPESDVPDSSFDRLLHNSQMAVQTMRDVVWSIDTNADTAGALLDRMRDQLDQLADSRGVIMELHTAGLPDTLVLAPALRQHLYLIFKEAITNAVRHATNATTIHVNFTRVAGFIELEIVDDGAYQASGTPVRPASGLGLRNLRHRAQALGGELETGARRDGQPGYRVWVRVKS